MAETNKKTGFRQIFKQMAFKALKATAKGTIVYAIYFFLWTFFAPVAEILPGLQQSVETFVTVYIILIVISELTSGTIFQYFFGTAKALFVILYLILALNGGIFALTFQNINLIVDFRVLLSIAMLLSLLGLAKSILQAVNYMNERAEYKHIRATNL